MDSNGNVVARYDYDAYGKPTQTAGTMQFDFLYTGHLYQYSTELYLAPYRAYNAQLGRWISRDPIGIAGGLNLYGYVGMSGNFGNSITVKVEKECLAWPSGWQKFKGLFGQRIYTGGGTLR